MNKRSVIVVGGGVAGLKAAHLLTKAGIDVTVVEADKILGGRVKIGTLLGKKIDIGGEFIHGQHSSLKKLADEQGWPYHYTFDVQYEASKPLCSIYFGRERLLVDASTNRPDVQAMWGALNELEEYDGAADISYMDFLVSKGVPYSGLGVADTLFSKTWSTDIDRLSVQTSAVEDGGNEEGGENFRLHDSNEPLLRHLASPLAPHKILLSWQARQIERTSRGVRVINDRNEVLEASHVIVAVPFPILRDDIRFVPPLPPSHTHALATIQMGAALKVIVEFSRAFWPPSANLVLCTESPVGQIWNHGVHMCRLTAFISGSQAVLMATWPEAKILAAFLQQLDQMYWTEALPNPGTSLYKAHAIYNWATHPFSRGSYTYPSLHARGQRKILAQPIDDTVFFAGEHVNEFAAGTIHGAMDSGEEAAKHVLRLCSPTSRL